MTEEKSSLTEDLGRDVPITFRFPRGTSGRELAVKFNELMARFGIENRSEMLRTCIEQTYSMYQKKDTVKLLLPDPVLES